MNKGHVSYTKHLSEEVLVGIFFLILKLLNNKENKDQQFEIGNKRCEMHFCFTQAFLKSVFNSQPCSISDFMQLETKSFIQISVIFRTNDDYKTYPNS